MSSYFGVKEFVSKSSLRSGKASILHPVAPAVVVLEVLGLLALLLDLCCDCRVRKLSLKVV